MDRLITSPTFLFFLLCMQLKLILTRKVVYSAPAWPHFKSDGFWKSGVAYCFVFFGVYCANKHWNR